MENLHCHNGYCEPIIETTEITVTEKFLMVGGYLLLVAFLGALTYYGVSMGYYPDLTAFN